MKCEKCSGQLEVYRACRKIAMRCSQCGQEYQIHEIAHELDEQTEKLLEQYNVIIYD